MLLGDPFPAGVPTPARFESRRHEARVVRYFKFNDRRAHKLGFYNIQTETKTEIPSAFAKEFGERVRGLEGTPFSNLFEDIAAMAQNIFERFGDHKSFLFIVGADNSLIELVGTEFSDQADKYLFWRYVGDLVKSSAAAGLIWVAEAWIREAPLDLCNGMLPIREIPIVGEELDLIGINRSGEKLRRSWRIERPHAKPPILVLNPGEAGGKSVPNFLVPALRALGLTSDFA